MSTTSNRFQDLRSLRLATVDGSLANALIALIGGFMVPYVKFATTSDRQADYWIGILAAMPSFIGLIQIIGAQWGRAYRSYKWFVAPGATMWRLCHIPLIFLPFALISANSKMVILVTAILLAAIAAQITGPIYNEWLGEMVPANSRGWYFSRRNAIITAVAATVGLGGGYAMDYFKNLGEQRLGFTVLFTVAVMCGLASLIPYFMMGDKKRETTTPINLRSSFKSMVGPLHDKAFRPVLIFLIIFIIGQSFGGSLYDAYALESLKVDYTLLMQKNMSMAIGNVAFARIWGFLADRYGNKPVLILLGLGLALTPMTWMLTWPGYAHNWTVLIIGHLFNGFIWGGIGIVQFNLLLATAKPEDKASYLGLAQALMAGVGGLSPMLGTIFFHTLASGGMMVAMAYKTVFGVCMLLRLIAVIPLLRVREEGASDLGSTFKQIKNISPSGYLALGKLNSPDVDRRETAMEGVASKKFGIATEELVNALHDPTPRVRRKAAHSLSRLGDHSSAEALIHMLQDHPDLVEDETIDALGSIGNPVAVPILRDYLQSPRPQIRRAAARAIGDIGGEDATDALIAAAGQEDDPDLRRAALQGLRYNAGQGTETVLARGVLDANPSVRIAAAEAISELKVVATAPQLRSSLAGHFDEASSEVAYALGCVGNTSDIPQILDVASKCISMITRRRCLLGIAALLDVERETYQLMLLSGMSRDSALLDRLKGNLKSSPHLKSALDAYSMGNEQRALARLAKDASVPELSLLLDPPVDEAFLVAALRHVRVHSLGVELD